MEDRLLGKMVGENGTTLVKVYVNGMEQWITFDTLEQANEYILENFM